MFKLLIDKAMENVERFTKMKTPAAADIALKYVGQKEVPGPEFNPVIVEFAEIAGIKWVADAASDEIPWCAVFANAMLTLAGKEGTKAANAKSFLKWGIQVTLEEVAKNPRNVVAIYHRGKTADSTSGHVELVELIDLNSNSIILIGGNVGDKVTRYTRDLELWLEKSIQDGTRAFIEFRRAI